MKYALQKDNGKNKGRYRAVGGGLTPYRMDALTFTDEQDARAARRKGERVVMVDGGAVA